MANYPRVQAIYDQLKAEIKTDESLLAKINALLKITDPDQQVKLLRAKGEAEQRLLKTKGNLERLERLRPVWGTLEEEAEEKEMMKEREEEKSGIRPIPQKPAYNEKEDELAELKRKLKGRGR